MLVCEAVEKKRKLKQAFPHDTGDSAMNTVV